MTIRIYYTDPYCARFEAVVTRAFEHEGRPAVVLDRTAFYPTSGGQPFDVGTLGDEHVVDTIDLETDGIAHVLTSPIEAGQHVHGEIDWTRRFDHMQQHTGQHVLSAAFDHFAQARTVSFHMSTDVSTIDLGTEVTPDQTASVELQANRVVWDDRPVSIRFVSSEEAEALPLRKDPVRMGQLRLIDVADFDLSACGGTHVGRTGAIGVIAVTGCERFRGGSRVSFVCGGRALRAFRTYCNAVTESIRALSVLPAELPAAVDRVQSEGKELRRTVKKLQESLALYEATRLVSDASPLGGVRLIAQALDGWDASGLKAIASAATIGGGVIAAVFSTSAPRLVVIGRSSDVDVDANAVLKGLIHQFGGRGGGKPDLAQGGGLTGTVDEVATAVRSLIHSLLKISICE
jgi:alanyl-tRNA synthetase